jgi:hypothetical protein
MTCQYCGDDCTAAQQTVKVPFKLTVTLEVKGHKPLTYSYSGELEKA